ncbi:MAG: hypothetical protein ACHQUB_02110 [Candidatus Saccharimonadia bacterium]
MAGEKGTAPGPAEENFEDEVVSLAQASTRASTGQVDSSDLAQEMATIEDEAYNAEASSTNATQAKAARKTRQNVSPEQDKLEILHALKHAPAAQDKSEEVLTPVLSAEEQRISDSRVELETAVGSDYEVMRAAAEREDAARERSGALGERVRAAEALDKLKTTKAQELVGGESSELIDYEAVKRDQIKNAQARLEALTSAESQIGSAASDQFLVERAKVTEKVSAIVSAMEHLSTNPIVYAAKNGEIVDLAVTGALANLVKQAQTPFLERNLGGQDKLMIKELLYHTDQDNRIVVERWNNSTGKLIATIVIEGQELTKLKADSRSTKPLVMMRGDFRKLRGKDHILEVASANLDKKLSKIIDADPASKEALDHAFEQSGSTSGDYGPIATRELHKNLTQIHSLETSKKLPKPRKRRSFFESLFGRTS